MENTSSLLNIWDSTLLMATIDIAIIGLFFFASWIFYHHKNSLRDLKILPGIILIFFGLSIFTFFYTADLVTMFLLPKFIPMKEVMETMTSLHLNYSWMTSLTGTSFITGGIAYLMRTLLPRLSAILHDLESTKIELEKDVAKRKESENTLMLLNERLDALVTERTKYLEDAQEKLVRSEKLAAVGQLASSVGHELRNPIGVIGNSAYYLGMRLKDSDEKVMKHLAILQREVQRSNAIITDLLDFSNASAPTVEEVDLMVAIRDALATIELSGNVVLETRLDEGLPTVLADAGQVRQVFQNLIVNASQAMPEGGRLKIEAAQKEDYVEIKIEDTGEGISEENLGNMFEPLFTTKTTGIGLGLAIVKGIIEEHKGVIEVTSEAGEGTTFTIKLPINN